MRPTLNLASQGKFNLLCHGYFRERAAYQIALLAPIANQEKYTRFAPIRYCSPDPARQISLALSDWKPLLFKSVAEARIVGWQGGLGCHGRTTRRSSCPVEWQHCDIFLHTILHAKYDWSG